ncbi:MAG: hypothetical protein MSS47_03140, partial [Bacteroidales bacterium]|nr:hypothetical protein [Bacteroidales bacterium]
FRPLPARIPPIPAHAQRIFLPHCVHNVRSQPAAVLNFCRKPWRLAKKQTKALPPKFLCVFLQSARIAGLWQLTRQPVMKARTTRRLHHDKYT